MDSTKLKETAAYIDQLLMEYYAAGDGQHFDCLTFLLADIFHYCDFHNLSYNAVVQAAKWHYKHDRFQ